MTAVAAIILSVLLKLTPHVSDLHEPPEARLSRMTTIAEDIAHASRGDIGKMAFLITKGSFESGNFASWVGAGCVGEPPPNVGDCDRGRARSYWQNHRRGCRDGWALPLGSHEAQRKFATCAVKLFAHGLARCKTLSGAYTAYGTGGSCFGLPSAGKRAAMHVRIQAQLERRLTARGEQR